MDVQPGVLIVDATEETRTVLCSALEQRGMRAWSAASSVEGLSLAERHAPDCIVVDLEMACRYNRSNPAELAAGFAAVAEDRPLVLLGNMPKSSTASPGNKAQYVAKPYHYAPLIRKIESLLAARWTPGVDSLSPRVA